MEQILIELKCWGNVLLRCTLNDADLALWEECEGQALVCEDSGWFGHGPTRWAVMHSEITKLEWSSEKVRMALHIAWCGVLNGARITRHLTEVEYLPG
jgi:hypothetical protein